MSKLTNPASDAFTVTPSDTASFAVQPRGIFVGGAGNVAAVFPSGTYTFVGVAAGTTLPIMPIRVNSTNTTATNMIGLFE